MEKEGRGGGGVMEKMGGLWRNNVHHLQATKDKVQRRPASLEPTRHSTRGDSS